MGTIQAGIDHGWCPKCDAPATKWSYCYKGVSCALTAATRSPLGEHLHYKCERCANEWGAPPLRESSWPESFSETQACPKCAETATHEVCYHAAHACTFRDRAPDSVGGHLHRICNVCGYEWAEPPVSS